jgi:DNA polymerase-3 subunit delta'
MNLEPVSQTQLFGLNNFLLEFIDLYNNRKLPNKILLSGDKGVGKSTLAYHLVNFVLSKDENCSYDINNFKIDPNNKSFKLIINKTNPNFTLVDITNEKNSIDINQIRELISNLNKSSFNNKSRFVLIDNIEFLNINSMNALLKIIEEPPENTYFILINNNRKILPTLKSRCLNFKIFLPHKSSLKVINKILDDDIGQYMNKDLLNYYFTPGNIYRLIKFASLNDYDLKDYDLKNFLKLIIKENLYRKNSAIKNIFFDSLELFFRKNYSLVNSKIIDYSYFLKRISDTRKFNLDEESLFMEFEYKLLNG